MGVRALGEVGSVVRVSLAACGGGIGIGAQVEVEVEVGACPAHSQAGGDR